MDCIQICSPVANSAMHFSSFNQIVSNQDRIGLSYAQILCKGYMGLQTFSLIHIYLFKICVFHIIWCKIKSCCAVAWKRTHTDVGLAVGAKCYMIIYSCCLILAVTNLPCHISSSTIRTFVDCVDPMLSLLNLFPMLG